jgi:hypothetical protein
VCSSVPQSSPPSTLVGSAAPPPAREGQKGIRPGRTRQGARHGKMGNPGDAADIRASRRGGRGRGGDPGPGRPLRQHQSARACSGNGRGLLDPEGTVVARQPDAEAWIGRDVGQSPIGQIALQAGRGPRAQRGRATSSGCGPSRPSPRPTGSRWRASRPRRCTLLFPSPDGSLPPAPSASPS